MYSHPKHIRILAGNMDNKAGSSIYNFLLAKYLKKRGYKISIICFTRIQMCLLMNQLKISVKCNLIPHAGQCYSPPDIGL